jgi:histidyl-tRNA synthetase
MAGMKAFTSLRGMRDLLPEAVAKKRLVVNTVRECFRLYGYEELETPVLESLRLLNAKAGEEIRHRLYSFQDLGGRAVALRAEMTPSVARIVANELRTVAKPLRLGYIANCFRYDNPQRGRYREFWQAGFELFGSPQIEADAEIIMVTHDLMTRLGFHDFTIKIGHVGILRSLLEQEDIDEHAKNVVSGLVDKRRLKRAIAFLEQLQVSERCLSTVKRLFRLRGTDEEAILAAGHRALSATEGGTQALGEIAALIQLVRRNGATADLLVDLGFARGLEYYTGMIFEVFVPDLGIALGGGGRYDKLVELFRGESTAAVGCAPGIDRIVLAMEKSRLFPPSTPVLAQVLVVPVTEELSGTAFDVAAHIRTHGISAQSEMAGRSVRAALSYADKRRYAFTVIVGTRELERGCIVLRDMQSNAQREVKLTALASALQQAFSADPRDDALAT